MELEVESQNTKLKLLDAESKRYDKIIKHADNSRP